jgi:hypothetical protein
MAAWREENCFSLWCFGRLDLRAQAKVPGAPRPDSAPVKTGKES